MDDLIAFLCARLDEDERAARSASDGPWFKRVGYISGGPTGATRVTQQAQAWNADHIVRHDPARVLREVAAKRKIIDRASDWTSNEYEAWPVLAMLALAYSDHPGYRSEEWKP